MKALRFLLVLISNLYPLFGFFYLGWNPYSTVLVYWVETVIILISCELKTVIRLFQKQWVAVFSVVESVMLTAFSAFHLILSTGLFATYTSSTKFGELFLTNISMVWSGILIMLLYYINEFIHYVRNKLYLKKLSGRNSDGINSLTTRVAFMQGTIIFGGMIAKFTGNIAAGVSLLVILIAIQAIAPFFRKSPQNQNSSVAAS